MLDLNLDTQLQNIANPILNPTGFSGRLISFLRSAFGSTTNPFGSAAVEDAEETGADNVTLITATGKIDPSIVPNLAASKFTRDVLGQAQLPDLSADKFTSGILNSDRLGTGGNNGEVLTKNSTSQEWGASPIGIKASHLPPSAAVEGTIMLFTGNTNGFPRGLYRYENGSWSAY